MTASMSCRRCARTMLRTRGQAKMQRGGEGYEVGHQKYIMPSSIPDDDGQLTRDLMMPW